MRAQVDGRWFAAVQSMSVESTEAAQRGGGRRRKHSGICGTWLAGRAGTVKKPQNEMSNTYMKAVVVLFEFDRPVLDMILGGVRSCEGFLIIVDRAVAAPPFGCGRHGASLSHGQTPLSNVV